MKVTFDEQRIQEDAILEHDSRVLCAYILAQSSGELELPSSPAESSQIYITITYIPNYTASPFHTKTHTDIYSQSTFI